MAGGRDPLHAEEERYRASAADRLQRRTRVRSVELAFVGLDERRRELPAIPDPDSGGSVGGDLARAGLLRRSELREMAIRNLELLEPPLEAACIREGVFPAADATAGTKVAEEVRLRSHYRGEEPVGVEAVDADRGDPLQAHDLCGRRGWLVHLGKERRRAVSTWHPHGRQECFRRTRR